MGIDVDRRLSRQDAQPAPGRSRRAGVLARGTVVVLGLGTIASVGLLLAWDVAPALFPGNAHLLLGAAPLALVAVAYLAYQAVIWPGALQVAKAAMLALAFLFWAVNQVLGDGPRAVLFNDLAIALFVFDVVLTMAGWPPGTNRPDDNL